MNHWIIDDSALPSGKGADFYSTIYTVGNGGICTRGTGSDERAGVFRGTYIAGLFTRAAFGMPYLMQAVDWLPIYLEQAGHRVKAVGRERCLDLRHGVLRCGTHYDLGGVSIEVNETRFLSFIQPDCGYQRVEVITRGNGEPFRLIMGLDGLALNARSKYFKGYNLPLMHGSDRLRLSRVKLCRSDATGLRVVLRALSTQSWAAAAAGVRQAGGKECAVVYRSNREQAETVFTVEPTGTQAVFAFEKAVRFTHGHGPRVPVRSVSVPPPVDFDYEYQRHAAAVAEFWQGADIKVEGSGCDFTQLAVRFAVWSTRIAAPDNDGRSSVGARNLNGDMYRGGVFWDMEMFQFPLLAAVDSRLAANHIKFRHSRLPAARHLAACDGYRGARYPWAEYDDGKGDPGCSGEFPYQEIHVNHSICWSVLHYYAVTADMQLILDFGLELVLEICNWLVDRCEGPDKKGHWHLRSVCGPDEFHKKIDDNAYTNILTAEILREVERLIGVLAECAPEQVGRILRKCGCGSKDRRARRQMADNMYIPFWEEKGIIEQFAGFRDWPEPDRVLNNGLWGQRDKLTKQADTIALEQVLPGYLESPMLARCYSEYAPLCTHLSSLSRCTHALVAARLGRMYDAEVFFRLVEGGTLNDIYGGTAEGTQGAGNGGLWLALVAGFGGWQYGCVAPPRINPALPPFIDCLEYRVTADGNCLRVSLTQRGGKIENHGTSAVEIEVPGSDTDTFITRKVAPGATLEFPFVVAAASQRLEAVIFDLDGVLVTTDCFHYRAWKELADELGLAFDEQMNHQLRGISREDSLRTIYRNNPDVPLPPDDVFQQQCARKNERYVELLRQMTQADVLPGARELLVALRAAGIRTGLASASKNAPLVLKQTGLGELIDAAADGRCVLNGKPEPDVFLVAAERLRVLPWCCIGVEDAATGIEAIHRAGMPAVAVGTQAAGGDITVNSTAELSAGLCQDLWMKKSIQSRSA